MRIDSHWMLRAVRAGGLLAAALSAVACSSDPMPADGGGGDSATTMMDGSSGLDATTTGPDGTVIGPDGTVIGPDGTVIGPDGAVIRPDVTVATDARVDGTSADGASSVCVPVACAGGGGVAACADCMDNDGDGRTDDRDPECLGPCDNTEGPVLLTGVPGETGGRCLQDCYFDAGNGSGRDDCRWDHRCDPLSVAPNFPPEGSTCPYDRMAVGGRSCPAMQSTTCVESCRPITPNGCDCFGCCTFPAIRGRSAAMGGEFVWLGSRDAAGNGTCTLSTVTDTNRCQSCTPVPSCFNDCGPCEVCLGRPMPPPECFPPPPPVDGGVIPGPDGSVIRVDGSTPTDSSVPRTDAGTPASQCPAGIQPCGLPGQSACPALFYCTTGCCIPIPG